MISRWGSSLVLAVLLAAFLAAPAPGQAFPEPEPHPEGRGEDVYLSGPNVDVTHAVAGDLIAAGGNVRVGAAVAETAMLAGGNVSLDGSVGDDVLAAGGEVALRGHVGDDARVAGGTVLIAGRVEDDATAVGGTVRVERDAVIGGRAWLAGGEIVLAGTVGREVRASGRRVSIEGTIHGDLHVQADLLEIGPSAQIDGDVVHRGPREPRVHPGARIGGRVEHRPSPEVPSAHAFALVAGLFLLGALFATGAVMILLFPRFTAAAAQTIESDPWPSLGVGALALFGAPALMLALFLTGIGIPLGLILLAGYLVALLLGYLVAAEFLGMVAVTRLRRAREPFPSKGGLILGLLAALSVLALLQLIPFLGRIVSLAALLFGMGALVLRLYRTYRGTGPAQPSPR